MKIIRDEEGFGMFMIPLFCDWDIRRCNQVNCKKVPNTIITGAHPEAPAFGLCEEHYQMGNVPKGEGHNYSIEFDNYDAFKARAEAKKTASLSDQLCSEEPVE